MFRQMDLYERITLPLAAAVMVLLAVCEHAHQAIPDLLQLALSLGAYALIAWKIVIAAFKGLFLHFRLNEQTLMVIATFGAFGIGQYPEALAVMIFYLIGEMFEEYARGRAHSEISSLVKLKPQSARVVDPDGSERIVKPRKVRKGEVIRVLAGEVIALDGALKNETAAVDTAALTGESEPRMFRRGEEIPSGCVNCADVIELAVTRDYRNSSITRLLNLIEDAAANKSRPEALIRRFAVWYTPIVVICAALMALVPFFVSGASWSDWGTRALVFLVVSCPCALVLSVPLSFFGGMGAISKTGVMIKGSVYLENLARLKALAFDKTGTVTSGKFTVTAVRAAGGAGEDEVLAKAAALEKLSNHPLARAVVAAAEAKGLELQEPEGLCEKAGMGLSAMLGGHRMAAGRYELAKELVSGEVRREENSGTDIYVTEDSRLLGVITLQDRPKPGAREAVAALNALGIKTCLITGDKNAAAQAAAKELGMTKVLAEQLPEDKLKNFEAFKEEYGTAGFVGDGINDAPVLAASDAGIAMGQFGSAAAVEAADIVVMNDDLTRIPQAVKLSRKTYALALENMWFSIGVKLLILTLGALGIAGIWLAIFGDVGVLILAVLNAMRALTFVKGKSWAAGRAGAAAA
ncbi:MAG: heavy metal translocating P-type ATPase [Succinivibrio sp.]|nr:heavy metal translocating P-type ATPase [Succinivibrio sp.]